MTRKMIYARIRLGIVVLASAMILGGAIFRSGAWMGMGTVIFALVALYWGYSSNQDKELRITRVISHIEQLEEKDQVLILQLVETMVDKKQNELQKITRIIRAIDELDLKSQEQIDDHIDQVISYRIKRDELANAYQEKEKIKARAIIRGQKDEI